MAAALVVTGIVMGTAGQVTAGTAAAVSCGAMAMAVGVSRRVRTAFVLCGVFGAAASHGALARAAALSPSLLTWFDAASTRDTRMLDVVEIEGRLIADAVPAEGGVRVLIDVTRLRHEGASSPVAGRVQAHVAGQMAAGHVDDWTAGRSVRAPALLRRPQVWRNFGGPSETWQQLRRPFDLTATIKSAALVSVERGAIWHEVAARARRTVRQTISRRVAPADEAAAAVAIAILIGDRASLDTDVVRRLQAAGTYHVIAISGGNVAVLTALCFLGLRLLIRSAPASAVLTMAVISTYGWVVGGEPSVARAVCAACLYLSASAIGLRPRPLHLLASVAALLATADPLMTIEVGAWLSFGATLGIVVGATRLTAMIDRAAGGLFNRGRLPAAVVGVALRLLAATAAAELVLLPIAAAVFGRVTVAGLLLNFVAIPAMVIVQCAGLAVLALDWIAPAAAAAAATMTVAARMLMDSAQLVEIAPWLSWRVPPVPFWWLPLYYAAAAGVMRGALRVRVTAGAIAAISLLVIVTAPDVVRGVRIPRVLRLVTLDVGQGDALLLQLPLGQAMLVDTGGAVSAFDVGARIVTPAIWAQRVSRLDWLAITHPDQDHIGGALSVAADLTPREIWDGVAVPRSATRAALRDFARGRGIVWRQVRLGERLEAGGVRIDVLHPPPPDWERQRVRNDDSIVLRVRYGDVEFLLTGDAGAEFEASATLGTQDAAAVRILKAAHHGSRSSSTERFLRGYVPDIVLISAGRGNLFGHPAPDVLDRFHAIGAQVFRTDRDGAVMLETDGRIVRVRAYGGRTWVAGVLRTP